MGDTDMGHMDHLEAVAAADVAFVRMREKTYRGSWKRRGGVGAFMMLARKWDRLEEMLGFKDGTQYNIFAAIEAKPSGGDGSTLAEVRDLRRYLLLVEAEMVSRGVVKYEESPVLGRDLNTGYCKPVPEQQAPPVDTRLFDRMAEVWGISGEEAAERLRRIAFGAGRHGGETPTQVMSALQYKWRLDQPGVMSELHKIIYGGPDTMPRTDSNRHAAHTEPPAPPAMRSVTDGLQAADYIALHLHYLPVPDQGHLAIVDRRQHPEVGHLPRLYPELNHREHADLAPEYRWMYDWEGTKYLLRDGFREHWGREP